MCTIARLALVLNKGFVLGVNCVYERLYFHLGSRTGQKIILISSPVYTNENMVSNFSFLFAIFLGVSAAFINHITFHHLPL